MKLKNILWSASAVCAALMVASPSQAQVQHMANPSYFYPGPLWTKLEAAAPTASIAIMNPNSGSGAAMNPVYASQVADAQRHGVKVLGYVDTAYAKRPMNMVKADIENYYKWYHVNGILFDEASNLAPDIPYYRSCYLFVHGTSPDATVVINPGDPTVEGYMSTADIIITFESPYSDYQNSFVQAPWVNKYPASRFWHIILGASTEDEMKTAIMESKQRHAGWVYVTTLAPPANPYDMLPDEPYWSDELSAIRSAK